MFGIITSKANNANLYGRQRGGYHNKVILSIIIICHLYVLFLAIFFHNYITKVIALIYFLSFGLILTTLIFARYREGFRVLSNEIEYYRNFKKKHIKYCDINGIVVSAGMALYRSGGLGRYRIKYGKLSFQSYPWFTICSKSPSEIMKREYDYTLTGRSVDELLRKDIFVYSFCYNKKMLKELLENYQGDYYITRSLATQYWDDMQSYIDHYNISNMRIHIVSDKVRKYL